MPHGSFQSADRVIARPSSVYRIFVHRIVWAGDPDCQFDDSSIKLFEKHFTCQSRTGFLACICLWDRLPSLSYTLLSFEEAFLPQKLDNFVDTIWNRKFVRIED